MTNCFRPEAGIKTLRDIIIKLTYLILALCIGNANACRYSPSYPPDAVAALAKDATFVVEATLISSTTNTSGHFVVHNWIKGKGSAKIEIGGFGHGTDCRSPLYRGRSILFLNKSNDDTYQLRELVTYSGMRPATKGNIEAVSAGVAPSDYKSNE